MGSVAIPLEISKPTKLHSEQWPRTPIMMEFVKGFWPLLRMFAERLLGGTNQLGLSFACDDPQTVCFMLNRLGDGLGVARRSTAVDPTFWCANIP